MTERRITPVILSGGSGTRLWPMSSPERPKQFLALTGEETMLQMTVRRVADEALFERPLVVASGRHAELVETQLAEIGVVPARVILEPSARNTAAAIALAALAAKPDALLLVMPSDHLIARPEAFIAAVKAAAPVAGQSWLVTFGIRPTHAETGYGYIGRGEALSDQAFRAEAFVEKPDLATATRYLEGGNYDWNGGIFLFRADVFLAELERHDPAILAAARAAFEAGEKEGSRLLPDAAAFAAAPSRSVDYAVMERAERVAVVPVDMGWSDLGSWDALYAIETPDERGNVTDRLSAVIDAGGCLIRSEGPRVTLVGVEDLIVVATAEEVLIAPRGQSQRVKEAADLVGSRAKGGKEA